jgi:hypothetical protein
MADHIRLEITRHTSATDVINFLRQAHSEERLGRKFNVRAVEKTYIADGKSTTVKMLFVRSGRETLGEWFSNLWNRKSQYALASRTLSYGLLDLPRYHLDLPAQSVEGKDLRLEIFQAGQKYADRGVPVSTFNKLFA